MLDFAAELYPICRSITGNGVRDTLRLVQKRIPLVMHEIPSGSAAFDWDVPQEWNINDAYVADRDGRRVIDFQAHNLHVVSYSEPIRARLPLTELTSRLHVHATNAEWIPYRTSYYTRNWGFCLSRAVRDTMQDEFYDVVIDSSLTSGALTYGECVIPGRTRDEVLLFTHVCHPSLANDNTSGIAIATRIAEWLAAEPRRFTYRIVFAPGTIGSLCWLSKNETELSRVQHGLVLGLLGDSAPLTYKQSRRGNADIDAIARYVLETPDSGGSTIPFEPYGYDERQLCSPGFNLPVGRLTRSVNDGYPEYHSSADNVSLLSSKRLEESLVAIQNILSVAEGNRRYINLSPQGEPRLGKRGLYGAVGGQSPSARERAMLWVLSDSDGTQSLLDTARRSGLAFDTLRAAAEAMEEKQLLKEAPVSTVATRAGRATGSKAEPRQRAARTGAAGAKKATKARKQQ